MKQPGAASAVSIPLLCLFLVTCFLSCSAAEYNLLQGRAGDPREIIAKHPDAGHLIKDVPFIPQERYACGPASVAMVLRFHGKDASQEEIAERFFTDAVPGTFPMDLMIAATEAGMEAHWRTGSMHTLKQQVDQDRPVIVFLNLLPNPLSARHFAVAVGYLGQKGKDYVVLHSGKHSWKMVSVKRFNRQWERTEYMMMTVGPKAPQNVVELTRLGNLFLKQGKPEAAVRYYMQALEQEPDNFAVLNNLSEAWRRAGDYNKALLFAGRAVKLSGGRDPRALHTRAEARMAAGDREAAVSDYRRAMDMCEKVCKKGRGEGAGEGRACEGSWQEACKRAASALESKREKH